MIITRLKRLKVLHYFSQFHSLRQRKVPRRKEKERIVFLDDLKKTDESEKALALFYEYHRKGFIHEYPSFASLVYKLLKCRNFAAVDDVLAYVRETNISCKESLFTILFEHYRKMKMADKAVELFNEMTAFNCSRTATSFHSLLNLLVDCERLTDANVLFKRSKQLGFRLKPVAYNVMIKGWLKEGNLEKAWQVLEEMTEREVEPTIVTYNSIIGHLCRNGEVEKAKKVFEGLIEKSKPVNEVTYALLMEGMCLNGEFEEAKKLLFDMEYRGCKPRQRNYAVLMNDLGRRGVIDEAKMMMGEMKKRKMKPDAVTYNILVNFLSKSGRVREAHKMFYEMQVNGLMANAATYRFLVDGYCKDGDFEAGVGLFNAMVLSGHYPRLGTLKCLVFGLLLSENVDYALYVVEDMARKGLELSEEWNGIVSHVIGSDAISMKLFCELVHDL